MKISFERRLILFFAIIFLVIIVLGIFSVRSNKGAMRTNQLIEHTKDVISETEAVLSLSKDIIIGTQRYVITGDSSNITSFPLLKRMVFTSVKRLKVLTGDNPMQQVRIDSLNMMMINRIGFSEMYLKLRKENGFDAANRLIATGRGRFYADRIKNLISEIEGQENALLLEREVINNNSVQNFNRAFYALIFAVFTFLIAIFFYIRFNLMSRARAEEELKSSRENFKRLFEYAPYPMWVYDLETLEFLEVNHAATEQYGYTHEEFLKMHITDIRPDADIPRLMESVKMRGQAGPQNSAGWKHVLGNGKIIDVEITSQLFNFSNHEAALVIASNVTEKKRRDEEMKQTNYFLDTILENIPNMIFVKDADHLRFIRFNKAGENLLGYTRKDLLGKNDYDFFPKEQADFFTEKDRDVIKNENLVDISEETIDTAYGKRILHTKKIPILDEQKKPMYLLGISEDITEKKKADERLRDLNERFLKIFNISPVAMAISEVKEGRYLQVNENFEKLFGFTKEEIIGKSAAQLKITDEVRRNEIIDVIQSNQGNVKGMETYLFTASGRRMDMIISVESIDIDNKKHFLTAYIDITERKQTEEKIHHLNTELEKNVDMLQTVNKELEAFSYSVSHDLRAPLRIIDGYANILASDYKSKIDEEGNKTIAVIRANARKMGQLIDDLLNLSRLGRKELSLNQVNMNNLVRSVIDEQHPQSTSAALEIKINNLETANADKNLLMQVWTNLISNAVKYSRQNPKPFIEIGSEKTDKEIIYYVKDNGVGFDMQYSDKLFGVFQRLHKMTEFEGTGVGLAVVKRIIAKHNGRVWADAKVNQGATFFFSLPIS